jgi:four helix bundle protein
MTYLRFENLRVWKKSAQLSSEIYIKLMNLKDFDYRSQITKSALSISSNIAEGFERKTSRDCIRFLYYAKGSCGELRSQIYIGLKINYIDATDGKRWLKETENISYMLSGLIRTRKNFNTKKLPDSNL